MAKEKEPKAHQLYKQIGPGLVTYGYQVHWESTIILFIELTLIWQHGHEKN